MKIGNIQKVLEKIRKHEDLIKFQKEESQKFCEKYNISAGQFNFLLSVVAAERIQKMGVKI
jgi:hypothetical protein